MSQRSQRKEEHLALAKMFFNSNKDNDFNHVHLIRPALPESAVSRDSISTEMFGHTISAPFFINAMTGGSDTSYTINQRLAKAAAAENIPMALGSASILEKEIDQIKSFEVARQENPDGLIFANVNPTTDPKVAQKIGWISPSWSSRSIIPTETSLLRITEMVLRRSREISIIPLRVLIPSSSET